MNQEEFAGRFGFGIETLRHSEQKQRVPDGRARAYLLSRVPFGAILQLAAGLAYVALLRSREAFKQVDVVDWRPPS